MGHGGANSMHEALSLRVPMMAVPVFGDQPLNADAIAACGAGIAFRNPLKSVTPVAFRAAIDDLTFETGQADGSSENKFRGAVAAVAEKLSAAGGVTVAVDAIVEEAHRYSEVAKKGGA